MKKLFQLILLTALFQTTFGQKQKLGFNLITGQTYYHLIKSSSSVEQNMNGKNININITISGKIAFKVTDINDSSYDMNVSYQQLATTMKLPNRDITFNSEKKDDNDILSTILGAIINKDFFVKMTKVGRIVEVKNLDSIFESTLDKVSKLTTDQKQQIKGKLIQSFGEKTFKGSFEVVTAIYSNFPVEKNDSWIIKTNLETGMSAILLTTFILKDKAENYNLIIGDGKIETLDKNAYVPINGMTAKYDLTGTMKSSLKVDSKTGWIMEAEINQLISGNAEIKDNERLPGGITIPMSIKTDITYSSK